LGSNQVWSAKHAGCICSLSLPLKLCADHAEHCMQSRSAGQHQPQQGAGADVRPAAALPLHLARTLLPLPAFALDCHRPPPATGSRRAFTTCTAPSCLPSLPMQVRPPLGRVLWLQRHDGLMGWRPGRVCAGPVW
jgi:hypothetical protein